MCGIAGKLFLDGARPVNGDLIGRMTDTLRHRGPDDGGTWVDGAIGLGSRRLAVLDLSPRGHMPMSNEDGSVWIVFNGEIYNFQELRDELRDKGHRFRSDSDTETVVHLYEEAGIDLLHRLRGMFAFAIWDRRSRTLLLARDRLGKKPLFYSEGDVSLAFGSEPKALLQDPDLASRVDPVAVHHYLTYGYVPTPFSAFRGMRKLPPAHYLLARNGTVTIHRYWSLQFQPKHVGHEDALTEELLALIEDAVRIRLVSDVPVGALLSGGVDSSLVVALMRRLDRGPVRTFSIGFDQPEYDELPHARVIARRFDTEHHELVVHPDVVATLPRLVWHYNEPFADSSALPSFHVCELARRSVTVALAGDGGDELFGGYDRFVAAALAGRLDPVPVRIRSAVATGLARILPAGSPKSRAHRLARFLDGLPLHPVDRYATWIAVIGDAVKEDLYTPDFAALVASANPLEILHQVYRRSDAADFVDATLHADVETYLPDDLLVKMDIASMACSLEVRSPLLDHHVVEFAARLPRRLKLRGLTTKYLLKRAMKGILPQSTLARKKMGFGVPIDRWLREDLREVACDILLDTRATSRGYFRKEGVRRLLDEHLSARRSHHHLLWSLLMLELWHRMFIDQPCPAAPPSP